MLYNRVQKKQGGKRRQNNEKRNKFVKNFDKHFSYTNHRFSSIWNISQWQKFNDYLEGLNAKQNL